MDSFLIWCLRQKASIKSFGISGRSLLTEAFLGAAMLGALDHNPFPRKYAFLRRKASCLGILMENPGKSTEGGTGIKIGGRRGLPGYVVAGLMMGQGGIDSFFKSWGNSLVREETKISLRDFCGTL
jgi:hypothetical protein